jgi:hypothetical protein
MRDVLLRERPDVREVVVEGSECDLAVSLLSMHWEDDLDAELSLVASSLKPDAPFVGCMWSTGRERKGKQRNTPLKCKKQGRLLS